MKLWPQIQNGKWLDDIFRDMDTVKVWKQIFNTVYSGKLDTWDYQWAFSILIQNGLCILPNVNMVSNIGCNSEATHTKNELLPLADIPSIDIEFPLEHPPFMIRDDQADMAIQKQNFHPASSGILINFITLFQHILKFIPTKSKKRYGHNQ